MPCDLNIVLKAQGGDASATDALCRQLHKLIRHLAKKSRIPSLSEDMMQEAYLAVLEVLPAYDPERGATFETYATPYLRAALRKGRQDEEPLPGTGHYSPRREETDPLEILIAREQEYREPTDLICLTDVQREVVTKTFGIATKERSTREIAAGLGLSERRVQQILAEALERLRSTVAREE